MIGLALTDDGKAIAKFRIVLVNDGSKGPVSVHIEPRLVADGSGIDANDLPVHLLPTLHSIRMDAHGLATKNSVLDAGLSQGEVIVAVHVVAGAAVTVVAQVHSKDAA
jgi:hypothetical protein